MKVIQVTVFLQSIKVLGSCEDLTTPCVIARVLREQSTSWDCTEVVWCRQNLEVWLSCYTSLTKAVSLPVVMSLP